VQQHRRKALAATLIAVATLVAGLWIASSSAPAAAQTAPSIPVPAAPGPTTSTTTGTPDAQVNLDLGGSTDGKVPTNSIVIILVLTVLAVAPSLLILMTGFTRIVIVLSLVRNALGLQSIPPNQVIVGLALFLSLFVMAPTLKQMNDVALQPLMKGEITQGQAWDAAQVPLKSFMLKNTRSDELGTFVDAAAKNGEVRPATPEDTPLTTLIPAFLLSELKSAFIIGFVVFVPFLVIDLVVSAVLMSLGMMMLPPVFVSLPFKILLFVMVGGWTLIAETLLESFR
jgi:flagellar biosynthetic protein FliP